MKRHGIASFLDRKCKFIIYTTHFYFKLDTSHLKPNTFKTNAGVFKDNVDISNKVTRTFVNKMVLKTRLNTASQQEKKYK